MPDKPIHLSARLKRPMEALGAGRESESCEGDGVEQRLFYRWPDGGMTARLWPLADERSI
jgi:hypothetical protein